MAVKAVKAPPRPRSILADIALRQRHHERLRLPWRHPVQPQRIGRRLFRAALQRQQDLQLYVGVAGESISFANRAAAEIDVYAVSARPSAPSPSTSASGLPVSGWNLLLWWRLRDDFSGKALSADCIANTLNNLNVMKKDVSFFEVYGKVTYTINDSWAFSLNEYYSPNFLNTGAGATTPRSSASTPRQHRSHQRVGMYVSGGSVAVARHSDSFYGTFAFRVYQVRRLQHLETSASASPTRCSRSICATPTRHVEG